MIGKVQRGKRINGLVRYLFGPGECNEHVNPHVVAGFRPPAALEPPLRDDGSRDVRTLNMLLNQPLSLIPEHRRDERPVRHVVLRAAPEDPILSDDDWAAIAHEVMDATGRAPYGDDLAVRWVAVRHAPDHIHIAFNLARQDGVPVPALDDYRALRAACQRTEQQYGLRSTAPADGMAAKRPTRAETEQAERSGRAEPVRVTLRRTVQRASAAAHSEPDFLARLDADGVLVRLRHSTQEPGSVTGYAVALPDHTNRAGEPVWFGGGKLAADLTLPRLRDRWTVPPLRTSTRPDMRAALRGTVINAASAARSEEEFFASLAEYGLRVRQRFSGREPGQITGYSVTDPRFSDRTGAPRWIAASHLHRDLALPRLRSRWAVGAPGLLTVAQKDAAWRYAADTVARAAADITRLAGSTPDGAADAAWAAADVLHVTARLIPNDSVIRRAADAYDRAARDLDGRTPPPSPTGADLRAAARMLANEAGEERERTQAMLTMIDQLGRLADAVARLRAIQERAVQAVAAERSLALLRAPNGRSGGAPCGAIGERPGRVPNPGVHSAVQVVQADFPHGPDVGLHQPHQPDGAPTPSRQSPRRVRGPRR